MNLSFPQLLSFHSFSPSILSLTVSISGVEWNSTDDCENRSRSEIENGNSNGSGVELVRQLSKRKEERKKVVNSEGRGGGPDSSIKFAYRLSAPAHRRIKESLLSSDAIFKQFREGASMHGPKS